ncbi:3-hexulose-6-phosphate synthase [Candidatus Vecturithrix granuli]|uniref:3-hexulose-6-phosphate synthase n=1 Tax=Vecturithrix granuli TaxID=1499967 RepID=A0A081BVD1_VECG1|nr:3-hexulose-6-phosphate synthase [Candidatus Vecturithrix granuli]
MTDQFEVTNEYLPIKSKPLLQIALDSINLDEVFRVAELVQEHVDILEIGTVLLKKEGIRIVEKMKRLYPDTLICADTKTVDLGKLEAQIMFEAGADLISVCGLASEATIMFAIHEARIRQKKVMIDLIGLGDSYRQIKRFTYLQPDYLTVYTGIDERSTENDLFQKVEIISQISPIPLAISGGVQLDDISYLLIFNPAIIIVGAAITVSSDPNKAAKKFWENIKSLSFMNDVDESLW